MRSQVLVMLVVFSHMVGASVVAQEQQQLVQDAIRALESTASCYDNLQAEWEEERIENGAKVSLLHRFWSREGRYFRLDSTFINGTSSEGQPLSQRIIVRPEGFVRLIATEGRPMAIVDFGSSEDGMARIYPNMLFRANQRGLLSDTTDFLRLLFKDGSPYQIEDVSRQEKTIKVGAKAGSDSTVYSYVYKVDLERGVCCGWEETEKRNSQVVSKTRVIKGYNDSCAPNFIKVESEGTAGQLSRTMRSISIKEMAAEIGIFSFGSQGISQGSVWIRRLVMLVVGIGLLGCIFLYRTLAKHG